jgi:hypothetical protein
VLSAGILGHRAGMDDTEVGQKGKSESQPDDVARRGIDALLAGKDHVYAASFKTKLEGGGGTQSKR